MQFAASFIIGGLLCAAAQIVIDKTNLTPAKLLVIYVVSGVVLTAAGLYEPLVSIAGAGATVPLTGFGYALAKGTEKEIAERGAWGILTGGISSCSAGLAAAIIAGWIFSVLKGSLARNHYK